MDAKSNDYKEILISERPEVLQKIVEGIANAVAPYGGIGPNEKLIFVGLVLGYASPAPITGEIKKFGVTSFSANYTSIRPSALYDSAARQAAVAENKVTDEAERNKGQNSAKVHDPLQ